MEEISKIIDICNILKEKNAKDILYIDLKNTSNILKFYILATVENAIHAKNIVDDFIAKKDNLPFEIANIEGTNTSNWRVVDFVDGFVHLFSKTERDKYNFEKLTCQNANSLTYEKLIKKQKKILEKLNK